MKKMMQRFKNERGITLVELLAVIVILAIVATIAFVLIGNVIENSKKDAHIANASQLLDAAKLYDVDVGFETGESNAIDDEILTNAGFLDKFIHPWDVDKDYDGTVTKSEETKEVDGEDIDVVIYKVNIVAEDGKCEFDEAKGEEDLAKGREIC